MKRLLALACLSLFVVTVAPDAFAWRGGAGAIRGPGGGGVARGPAGGVAALEAALPIAEALTVVVLTAAPITAAPGSSLAQRSVSQSALRRLRPLTTRRPIIPRRRIAAITAIHPVN